MSGHTPWSEIKRKKESCYDVIRDFGLESISLSQQEFLVFMRDDVTVVLYHKDNAWDVACANNEGVIEYSGEGSQKLRKVLDTFINV